MSSGVARSVLVLAGVMLATACDRPTPLAPHSCDTVRAERAEVTRTEHPWPPESLQTRDREPAAEVTRTKFPASACTDRAPTAEVPVDRGGIPIIVRRKP